MSVAKEVTPPPPPTLCTTRPLAKAPVHVTLVDRRHAAGTDRPDRLVRHGKPGCCASIFPARQRSLELCRHDRFGRTRVTLRFGFADADDHRKVDRLGSLGLGTNQVVALAVDRAALAMADDHEPRARINEHRGRHVTREGAAGFGVAILTADSDLLDRFGHALDQRERGGNTHCDLWIARRRTADRARFREHGARAVHFPIANDVRPIRHVISLLHAPLSPDCRTNPSGACCRRAARPGHAGCQNPTVGPLGQSEFGVAGRGRNSAADIRGSRRGTLR